MSYSNKFLMKKDVAIAALCDSLQMSRATLYRNHESEPQDAMNPPRNSPTTRLTPHKGEKY